MRQPLRGVKRMPKDLGARRYSNGGPESKEVCSFSAVCNGRGSRLGDDDANHNVPESKPSKRDRRNSPAHRHNKAGHRPRHSQWRHLPLGPLPPELPELSAFSISYPVILYRIKTNAGRLYPWFRDWSVGNKTGTEFTWKTWKDKPGGRLISRQNIRFTRGAVDVVRWTTGSRISLINV